MKITKEFRVKVKYDNEWETKNIKMGLKDTNFSWYAANAKVVKVEEIRRKK